jgi:hypothetical protein
MNVWPGSSRHARNGDDHGFLLAIANKVVVFEVVDVDLVKTFAFLYIGSAVDRTLYLGFRDFLCRFLRLDAQYTCQGRGFGKNWIWPTPKPVATEFTISLTRRDRRFAECRIQHLPPYRNAIPKTVVVPNVPNVASFAVSCVEENVT